MKNSHSGYETSHPKINNLIVWSFNSAKNVCSVVILTSPGFYWWDTGPASPEVWRLIAHGAPPDDCIYLGEFIAFYQPLIAEKHRSPALASLCVCAVVLLLPVCLSAALKFPSNFHKSTQSITAHVELRHLCAHIPSWSLQWFLHGHVCCSDFQ